MSNKNTSERIGCIPMATVERIGKTKTYFTKIAGAHSTFDCQKRAKNLGYLCSGDKSVPCSYFGRPTNLTETEDGECWVIGYDNRDYITDFNKTLIENVNQNVCQEMNKKLLTIYTTQPNSHVEAQKKTIYNEIKTLNNQIKTDTEKKKTLGLKLRSEYEGTDFDTLVADDKEKAVKQAVLEHGKRWQKVQKNYRIFSNIADQKQQLATERAKDLITNKHELNKMEGDIWTKNSLVGYYNNLFQYNNKIVTWLRVTIFLLMIITVVYIMYWNYDKIEAVGKQIGNTVTALPGMADITTAPNMDSLKNLRLSNLTRF